MILASYLSVTFNMILEIFTYLIGVTSSFLIKFLSLILISSQIYIKQMNEHILQ